MTEAKDPTQPWDVLGEEVLLEAPRLTVTRETVRLQDGRVIDDYWQIHMGKASVIAAQVEDGRYLLFEMYKHGPRRAGLGFPGGGVEEGESALLAAQRELLEETGYAADDWRELGATTVHSNQGCGFVSFFACTGARQVHAPIADDLEVHTCVFVTREELRQAMAEDRLLSMGHVCMAGLVLALT